MKKIFYSWQSDTAGNRDYLEEVLEQVATELGDYEIDTATKRVKGAVDIAQSIRDKIDEADFIIADISTINKGYSGRKTPNPNVLIELGYAMGKRGIEPIILIVNSDTTEFKDIPFDIQTRLTIRKKFSERNKAWLVEELKTIITDNPGAQSTEQSPYIYLELARYSAEFMQFRARNDEDVEYRIVSIELGGSEQEVSRGLAPKDWTDNVHTTGLINPPFDKPIHHLSFVVTRHNQTFRLYQRLKTSGRADEKYNLDSLEPGPYYFKKIPNVRPAPNITHLDALGDFEAVLVKDTETGKSASIKVTNSLFATWGCAYVSENQAAIEKLARAYNEVNNGQISGEVTFDTYNTASTLQETIDNLRFNSSKS